MAVDVLLGLQWGDEGKGKIVDYLAPQYDLVARFQGGPNAGHTLYSNGKKVVLHTIPSGILHKNLLNLIGNGVVIDPETLANELDQLSNMGIDARINLKVAKKAHLILPTHKILDAASEAAKGRNKIGSTLKGIGPAYMDKTGRNGLRVGDLYSNNFRAKYEQLKGKHFSLLRLYDYEFDLRPLEERWWKGIETLRSIEAVDGEHFVHEAIREGKTILAEGAQGSMLDVEFGTYPYVTSSNTLSSGVCQGLGVSPRQIRKVYGITKAYCTRVGSGPFPTELHDETGEKLRKEGGEFGATTGRPRRCGWIDLPALRYAIRLNGVDELIVTKVDILNHFDQIELGESYVVNGVTTSDLPYDLEVEGLKVNYHQVRGWNSDLKGIETFNQLPEELAIYISYLKQKLEVKISMISIGPDREALIFNQKEVLQT